MKTFHPALVLALALMLLGGSRAAALTTYYNDFSEESLPVMSGSWGLNAYDAVLNYHQPTGGGTVVGLASQAVHGAVTNPVVVVSTWFTVNNVQGTGTAPITAGLGAFSSADNFVTTTNSYYLADWGVGGGGTTGNLRILAQPSRSNFTNTIVNIGTPTNGATYELRLIALSTNGGLEMTLAVFNEAGVQIGAAATAFDTAPLAGPHFGLRNRTSHTSHSLNYDYRSFSVNTNSPPLPPPFQVQITDLNPGPDATFHPAAAGLRFSVTASNVNLSPTNISLFLDGNTNAVPLSITGASTSYQALFEGLEPNRFYTAKIKARDDQRQRTRTWNFNTLEAATVQTLQNVSLNQMTNDALQRLVGISTFSGTLPESGSLSRLNDATSATTPTANVIPSPDQMVSITWDLTGSPVETASQLPALVRIDLWLAGFDSVRTGYDGEFATSLNGQDFTTIPNSRFATALGTNTYNLLRYYFEPSAAGFRYLRFTSYGYDNRNESILRQPRIVEMDAVIAMVQGPAVRLNSARNGNQLILSWDSPSVLETAPELNGQWSALAGATSPYAVDLTNSNRFFRLLRND